LLDASQTSTPASSLAELAEARVQASRGAEAVARQAAGLDDDDDDWVRDQDEQREADEEATLEESVKYTIDDANVQKL
jgi:hypothetical protein